MAWKFLKPDGTKLGGGEKGWTFFAPTGIETGDGGGNVSWSVLTNGIVATPELIFAAGDVIMIRIP